jgi:hypothetical protein
MNPQELQRARVESEKYHQALQQYIIVFFHVIFTAVLTHYILNLFSFSAEEVAETRLQEDMDKAIKAVHSFSLFLSLSLFPRKLRPNLTPPN